MNEFSIRPAAHTDLHAIPGIEVAAASIFSEADLPVAIRYKVSPHSDLLDSVNDGRLWVATDQREYVVGFAMADIIDSQAYLDEVDVHPDFGRRGIGSRLVKEVVVWARQGDYSSLSLLTFRHLHWNAPFYEKLGFAVLKPMEYGEELAELIREETREGIDASKRVAMRMEF